MSTPLAGVLPDEDAVYAKVTLRLIPFLFLCYIVAFLDRVNVGFAKLQMQSDLGLSDTVYGTGAGIFFIGYFFFEVPSNLLMRKVGARFWIARIMITWGLISAATMFTNGAWTFYGLRFLLGVAEAGFFPGVILYLTDWYPARRRARVVAWFMMAIAATGVIGGPLSGWILQACSKAGGLAGWQWLFLLEGIPSVIIGIWVLFYLDNGVREAKWLAGAERQLLLANLESEERTKRHLSVGQTLRNPWVLLFSAIYFCISMGIYGIGFWLPQIIKNTGVKEALGIGLLTAVPYGCAAVVMVLVGKSSDLCRERRWHFAAVASAGGLGLILSTWFPSNLPVALAALSLATAGILSSFPLAWTMPTALLAGSAAAAGIAMVNSIGGLAGFVSPYLVGWVADRTHRLDAGLYVIASFLFLGVILVLSVVPAHLAGVPAHEPGAGGTPDRGGAPRTTQ
ncbi:MAG: MFS transporter [Verrucomicrobia bacterium]|nr:MFS transporter [Verrucomicrobiota bacterium]